MLITVIVLSSDRCHCVQFISRVAVGCRGIDSILRPALVRLPEFMFTELPIALCRAKRTTSLFARAHRRVLMRGPRDSPDPREM
jgi:hypothetical protein